MKHFTLIVLTLSGSILSLAQNTFLKTYDIEPNKHDQGVWIEKYNDTLYAWNYKIFGRGTLYCSFDLSGNNIRNVPKNTLGQYTGTNLRLNDTLMVIGNPYDDGNDSLRVNIMTIRGDSIGTISLFDMYDRYPDVSPINIIKTPSHYVMIAVSEPDIPDDTIHLESSIWFLHHDFTVDTIIPIQRDDYTYSFGLQLGPDGNIYVLTYVATEKPGVNFPYRRLISIFDGTKLIQEIESDSYDFYDIFWNSVFLVTKDSLMLYSFQKDDKPSLRCMDLSGNIKWEVSDRWYGQDKYHTRIDQLQDGNFMALGYIYGEGYARTAYMEKISREGNVMWQRIIGKHNSTDFDEGGADGYLWRLVEDSVGYMYMVGQLGGVTNDMVIMKTDSYGCIDQDRCNVYYVVNPLNGDHKYDQINQMQKQWYYSEEDKSGLVTEQHMTIGQDTILYDSIHGTRKFKLLYFNGIKSHYSLRWDVAGRLYRMYDLPLGDPWEFLKRDTCIYDFTLQLGDKFDLPEGFKTATVIKVDSIALIDSKLRKRIILRHDSPSNQAKFGDLIWIEGIGSPNGLFYYNDWINDTKTTLSCFYDRGVKRFGTGQNFDCARSQRAIPQFDLDTMICKNDIVLKLPKVSSNDIKGDWTPKEVNYTIPGEYVCKFEPYFEENAETLTLTFKVVEKSKPVFDIPTIYLKDEFISDSLSTISINNIVGSWNPPIVNSTTIGSSIYTFTPSMVECAEVTYLTVQVLNSIDTTDMDASTIWYSSVYLGNFVDGDCRQSISTIKVSRDTLIENRLSRILGVTVGNDYIVESELIVYSKGGFVSFFEDDQWKLLYNYNVKIKDSVTYYIPKNHNYYWKFTPFLEPNPEIAEKNPFKLYIDSIDVVYTESNIPLKRFHTRNAFNEGNHYMNRIIERVGSMYKFLGNNYNFALPDCSGVIGLRCYHDDKLDYRFLDASCDSLVATFNLVHYDVNLFPNPVQDILLVTIGEYIPAHAHIEFHTTLGQQIYRQRVYYGQNNIDLSGAPSGLYTWSIVDNGVVVKSGKVVKI